MAVNGKEGAARGLPYKYGNQVRKFAARKNSWVADLLGVLGRHVGDTGARLIGGLPPTRRDHPHIVTSPASRVNARARAVLLANTRR